MLEFVAKYGHNIHSQNGEDGIIAEVVSRLGLVNGHCVEMGGNDGQWLSNTCNLLNHGWSGLFVEYDYNLYLKSKANWAHNPRVRSQCAKVDGNNINAFVDERCDLLSLDTDGSDYDIFKGLKAFPKVVIVEIDSSIPPGCYDLNDDGACGFTPMVELAHRKGYMLIGHTGNLIFVDLEYAQLFPELDRQPITLPELHFNRSWLREEVTI